MRNSIKLAMTALVAAAILASAIGTASANRLSVSNRNIRTVWSSLEFLTERESTEAVIRCAVTIEGSFHSSTIAKALRSLIGLITRATVGRPCQGGEAWVHNGIETPLGNRVSTHLPWHITYEGFEGTLPTPTAIRLLLREILFTISVPFLCLGVYGEANAVVAGRAVLGAGGVVTALAATQELGVRASSTSGFCPNPGYFRASGAVTLLGTTTSIRVTLI